MPRSNMALAAPLTATAHILGRLPRADDVGRVAAIYNQAGDGYAAYADGDPSRLFAFDGLHGFADRHLWEALDIKLAALRLEGRTDIAILDAGCGPGTWLRRLVTRAYALGFRRITARGFDIAEGQIERARAMSAELNRLPGVDLTFEVGDLTKRLPEADASIDLTVCLYSVLSHLRPGLLPGIAAELARVTSGYFVATVRPVGSPPSIFVDTIEKACRFEQDNAHDTCRVELSDGRRFTLDIHLFTAPELNGLFAPYFDVESLRGLDLFHSRFKSDPRWNPASSHAAAELCRELSRIEKICAGRPEFIEHAAHLLLIGRARRNGGLPEA